LIVLTLYLRFSDDANLIASASDDKTIKLWDRNSKECIHTFSEYSGYVNSVAFHPGGTFIAAGSTDSTVKIWDLRTNKLIQHYTSHTQAINSVTFHPCGNYLLTASNDSTLKIFDLLEGKIFYTLHGHQGAALAVAFSKQGDYFASAGNDEHVMVWKTNFDQAIQQISPSNSVSNQTNRRKYSDNNIFHARPIINSATSSSSTSSSNRDPSPLTIPLNESVLREEDLNEPEPEQQIVSLTSALKNTKLHQGKPSKRLSNGASTGSILKKITNDNMSQMSNESKQLPTSITNTLEHIVQQLDMLTQTVSVLEQRITFTENKIKEISDTNNSSSKENSTNSSSNGGRLSTTSKSNILIGHK